MITLNQLITLYQDIATRHKQVNDFLAVQDFNIEMDNAPVYPLLVVNPVSANLPRTDNGYTSFNTTFELQVLDLVNKDNNNRMDVMSDTQQIITDVVNEFNTHPYYIDNSIDTISDISFDPIRGAYGGDVDGWKISITLQHPVQLSYCSAPVLPIQGFDFTAPAVTVIDGVNTFELYPADTYTCQSDEPKVGIQYQRPSPTGQTTSYALYDDAWKLFNNPYPDSPVNPKYCQELADFYTLKHNNAFGNKFRFTDGSGNNGTDGTNINVPYCIDNLTGLGWKTIRTQNKTFDQALTECEALTFESYSDWYLPNINELYSLFIYYKPSFSNSLVLLQAAENTRSSTTNEHTTTQSYHNSNSRQIRQSNKTQLTNYYPVRNHF